ncbi:MAG TPA: prepilin peptidase [Actinomycetota bacterium]|nr:prepilin peptidase [Actinomycetota bacterium]
MTTSDMLLRIAIALPLGLVFGSFLTVVIHRVPAGESLVRPWSRCLSCGTPLRNVDTIPVVSWLRLRGRCRACGARISAVYPLTELATGGLFVAVALVYEDPWQAILLAPFCGILIALSVIDIRVKRLPNRLVYPSVLIAAPYIVIADLAGGHLDAIRAGFGFLAYGLGLLIVALIAPAGMGMGDVKLAGLIGLVLGSIGLGPVAVAAVVGILLGGVGAIVALLAGAGRKSKVPYGPFMAGGALVAVFVGQHIANAYLDLIS